MAFPRKFTSWSFSRWLDYDGCPAFAAYKHLDKLPAPSSPALERGTEIHQLADEYVKGRKKMLPAQLKPVEAELRDLRARFAGQVKTKLSVFLEEMWGYDRNWNVVPWNDWANCWLRVKMDVAYFVSPTTLAITDHKTGKFRPEKNQEYLLQMSLYGLGGLGKFEAVTEVAPTLLYTDLGITYPALAGSIVHKRSEEKTLRKDWEKRVRGMFNDEAFKPKPGSKCRWCPYSKTNSGGTGPCKF